MGHLENIERAVGSLRDKRILDLGSGRGDFLRTCALRGYQAVGLEVNPKKIAEAQALAGRDRAAIVVVLGRGEEMPFADASFDFVNVAEVIEHVEDPNAVMCEIARVLASGGTVYVSVHNRFGWRDTHFHIRGVGWLPRAVAERYIALRKHHKRYGAFPDRQRLSAMHYYTFGQFRRMAERAGFTVRDAREEAVSRRFRRGSAFARTAYRWLARPLVVSTFHCFLEKRFL